MEGSQHGLQEIREDYPEQVGEALKRKMLAFLVPVSFLTFQPSDPRPGPLQI